VTKPVTWSPSTREALERIQGRLFCTTTEAGLILRYDRRTLRKGIESGEIPAVRVGATFRIPTAWLRERAGIGTDAA
jgi:excisionase family DNA binding protein